ncbi:phage major capsid protein, partial [Bacillus thuringiensis]|nr:phage major capsid protein [Bacillus thuringiensis]
IVQPNITVGTGRTLLGKELVVLPDAIFKNDTNDALVFVGDLYEAVTLFKRTEMTVRWQDHTVYGEMLAGAIRFDVEAGNTDAGKMLKLGTMVDNIASVRVVHA